MSGQLKFLTFTKKAMQQIARYDIEELNDESISKFLVPFKGRHVKVSIEEVKSEEKPLSQHEIYKRVMAARELFKDVRVDPSINLSDLANDVNL